MPAGAYEKALADETVFEIQGPRLDIYGLCHDCLRSVTARGAGELTNVKPKGKPPQRRFPFGFLYAHTGNAEHYALFYRACGRAGEWTAFWTKRQQVHATDI